MLFIPLILTQARVPYTAYDKTADEAADVGSIVDIALQAIHEVEHYEEEDTAQHGLAVGLFEIAGGEQGKEYPIHTEYGARCAYAHTIAMHYKTQEACADACEQVRCCKAQLAHHRLEEHADIQEAKTIGGQVQYACMQEHVSNEPPPLAMNSSCAQITAPLVKLLCRRVQERNAREHHEQQYRSIDIHEQGRNEVAF